MVDMQNWNRFVKKVLDEKGNKASMPHPLTSEKNAKKGEENEQQDK